MNQFLLGYRLLLCFFTAGASGAVPFVLRASRPTHDTTGGPSVTPGHGFSPEGDSILAEWQNLCEQEATGGAGRVDPTTGSAHTCLGRSTTGVNEEEDAGSSVSEVTAVGIGLRADLGTRMQAGRVSSRTRSPDSAPTQPTALR
ncbi:hypothetical protein MTO96_037178 [Rhipicephalus appendiculatus]